jgi:hypothetical protein
VVRIWMEPVVVIVDVVVLLGLGMLRQEQAFEIRDGLLEGRWFGGGGVEASGVRFRMAAGFAPRRRGDGAGLGGLPGKKTYDVLDWEVSEGFLDLCFSLL